MAQAGVLAGADHVLAQGVHAVRGVDVGALAQPASGSGGPVGDPQAVAPAVFGLEQGRLRAGVQSIAGRRSPWPCGLELVSAWPFAQQPGRLGDMRFLDPAAAVRAARVRTRVAAALTRTLPLASMAASQAGSGALLIAAFSRAASSQPTE